VGSARAYPQGPLTERRTYNAHHGGTLNLLSRCDMCFSRLALRAVVAVASLLGSVAVVAIAGLCRSKSGAGEEARLYQHARLLERHHD